jgi:hypothetical protein
MASAPALAHTHSGRFQSQATEIGLARAVCAGAGPSLPLADGGAVRAAVIWGAR